VMPFISGGSCQNIIKEIRRRNRQKPREHPEDKGSSVAIEVKTTLETNGKDVKLHSKRVEKIQNYTRNEWRRWKITLETSGEDRVKLLLRLQAIGSRAFGG
jgi:hypothetical protein